MELQKDDESYNPRISLPDLLPNHPFEYSHGFQVLSGIMGDIFPYDLLLPMRLKKKEDIRGKAHLPGPTEQLTALKS